MMWKRPGAGIDWTFIGPGAAQHRAVEIAV